MQGVLPQAGFVRQEAMPLDVFLANRFGRQYVDHSAHHSAWDSLGETTARETTA